MPAVGSCEPFILLASDQEKIAGQEKNSHLAFLSKPSFNSSGTSPEMASISTLQASSSTPNPHSYDVFLSFRGEDTRKNFTDHLYNTLVSYGIHTFRDDEELEKGEGIKSGLSRAIQGSKIFTIIFSENYATSKWCLNELVKIIEHTALENNKVIPVFYHVKPSDVGHQSGSFEVAFFNHEKDADQEKKELIEKWRIALKKAAKLTGYHVDNQ